MRISFRYIDCNILVLP